VFRHVLDVGQAINPAIDITNIEVAFIQGYGWMKNTTFSPEGKLETRGHGDYNMPTIADCPAKFNVTLQGHQEAALLCLLRHQEGGPGGQVGCGAGREVPAEAADHPGACPGCLRLQATGMIFTRCIGQYRV
jgi:hypothetical protein